MRRELGGGERAWAAQGADALERASRVRTVVFDKTGTLTRGAPAVTGHALFGGAALHGALALAAAAEASSEHPLARALLAYARARLAPGAPAGRGGAADEQAAGSPRAEGAPGKARVFRVFVFSSLGLTAIALHCRFPASLIGITKDFKKKGVNSEFGLWSWRLCAAGGAARLQRCGRRASGARACRRRGRPELGAACARCGGAARPRPARLGAKRARRLGGGRGRGRGQPGAGAGARRRSTRARRQPRAHGRGGRGAQQARRAPVISLNLP